LGAVFAIALFLYIATHKSGGMGDWGVSGAALREGRFETIFLHMFAHAGGWHIAMNISALAAIGPQLTARLGPPPLSWLRFLLLFLLSGLAGAMVYLLLHPTGTVPMLGASGALYGLLGLLIRTPANGEDMVSLASVRVRRAGWSLIKENAFLFALLAILAWGYGTGGGLAWEAHFGGFLFGLLVGPKFVPDPSVGQSTAQGIWVRLFGIAGSRE
jgi:membrane associated rhomboid family serine protease